AAVRTSIRRYRRPDPSPLSEERTNGMKRFNGPSLPALIFAALMPVLPAAAAVAQTGPPAAVQQRQPTPRIDADRDGGIDRKELIAERERIFARFDADGDDRLT